MLFGCGGGIHCKQSVIDEFPYAIDIRRPANQNNIWLVLDKDSSVWYVETKNLISYSVTSKEKIYSLK